MTSLLLSLIMLQDPVPLQEMRTVVVPPHINVTQASRTNAALYLLDRRSQSLLRVTHDSADVITDPSILGAVAITGDSAGILTTVIGSPAEIIRLTVDGQLLGRKPLLGIQNGTVVAAGHQAGAWAFVVDNDAEEGSMYCTRDPAAERYQHLELPFAPGPRLASTVADGHIYVTLEQSPYWTYAVDISECRLHSVSALASQPMRLASLEVGASWFPVAIARVGDELWITLADMFSDDRIVAVLGQNGALVRSRFLQVPLAIISARGKEVVALRNLSSQELVYYEVQSPVPPTSK